MSENETLLKVMEDVGQFVALMTGIKAQFVAAGWHEHTAERATIEMYIGARDAQKVTP